MILIRGAVFGIGLVACFWVSKPFCFGVCTYHDNTTIATLVGVTVATFHVTMAGKGLLNLAARYGTRHRIPVYVSWSLVGVPTLVGLRGTVLFKSVGRCAVTDDTTNISLFLNCVKQTDSLATIASDLRNCRDLCVGLWLFLSVGIVQKSDICWHVWSPKMAGHLLVSRKKNNYRSNVQELTNMHVIGRRGVLINNILFFQPSTVLLLLTSRRVWSCLEDAFRKHCAHYNN